MRCLLSILLFLLLLIAGGALYVGLGVYNVSAMVPHFEATRWFLDTLKDQSIMNHSQDIAVPSALQDAHFSAEGFRHYHDTCRMCHGAPGMAREPFAMGLYPAPPTMASGHPQEEWTDAQLFWIAKNGLKFTGMPAFGVTHREREIWSMVAFVKVLPRLTPETYQNLLEETGSESNAETGHQHRHPGDESSGGD